MVFNNHSEVKSDPDGESRELLERIFYLKEA